MALLKEERVQLMTPQSAFITFKNPFAAFLSKKMMKIIKRRKIDKKDRPMIFDREINISRVGYPTDTQYLNYGVSNVERWINFFIIVVIVYFWAYAFFTGMFNLYQMMQNRNLFLKSPD